MTQKDPTKVHILGSEPRIAVREETPQRTVVLYGSPTLNGKSVSDISALGEMMPDATDLARKLNGEFVLVVETDDQLFIANDRFASHPLFYAINDSSLAISFSYREIWRWLSQESRLKIDSLAFYEFLHFQRLFGSTTFDQTSKVLPPATALTVNKRSRQINVNRYWKPDFSKRHDGVKAIASDLAGAVRQSITQKTADSSNTSLMLSGGMDSRVAIGGFSPSSPPNCITVGASENNEVDVARAVAKTVGASHNFVQRPPNHYENILPQAVSDGGGMYMFQHGHFYDLDIPDTDLVMHGHGFDYFFQGMYLPASRKSFFGRPTRSYALDSIGFDLTSEYIAKAKYKLKGTDPAALLNASTVSDANDKLGSDIDSVLKQVNGETSEMYDDWDYLTTSAPSRHYTYLNLLSAGSLAEQRTIAFDNDIFDIYYSTPAKVRHGTRLLAETIRHLNPKLLDVRNANTNLRPDLTPARLTLSTWVRGAKRRIGLGGATNADPAIDDRSWPTNENVLRGSQSLRDRVNNLRTSQQLESLNIFDMPKVSELIDSFDNGKDSAATALLTLITIDEFIREGSS
jgi:hypothetical protein